MSQAKPKIIWEPKVPQWQIRRLYETDARGILDEEQINQVGWALWGRCDSILTVTAAHYGKVRCPGCETMIERVKADERTEIVSCPGCGWSIPWANYHQSYRGKQLFGANAVEIFEKYHKVFPMTERANQKMLLIDRLIHAFHIGIRDIGRPVAANLIEGTLAEVIRFLDALTNAGTIASSASGLEDSGAEWRQTLTRTSWYQSVVESKAGQKDLA